MTKILSKLLFIFFIALSATSNANAQDRVIQKIWKDGKTFIVKRTSSTEEGHQYNIVDDNNTTLAVAKISECKTKSCLGTIIQSKKDFQLKDTYQLVLIQESRHLRRHHGYLGYGGPMGAGIRLGYADNFLKNKWIVGGNLTRQQSSTNNVDITGNMISAEVRYPIFQFKKLKISALAEIGFMKLTLDFTEDSQGPSEDVSTYFIMTGVDLAYPITKSLQIVGKGLISKNGLESSYSNSASESYSNPYGKMLISSELGIRYFF
jgi:hypothetical protein